MRLVTSIVFLALALAACGGGARGFSTTFPDNRASDVQAVLDRLGAAPARRESPVVVGLTTAPVKLFAFDLAAGRLLWQEAVEAQSAPYVAGSLVAYKDAAGLVARDLQTGRVAFQIAEPNLPLVGADGEGDLAVISMSTGGGVGARSRVIVARGGGVARDLVLDVAAGVPAVHAGLVFLPWGAQNVTVLDAQSGAEVARVRIGDSVIGHALVDGQSVYFGQAGLFRLTPRITSGTSEQSDFFRPTLPDDELPGRPAFLRDAYQAPPPPDAATNRVRLAWTPGDGPNVGLRDGNLYLAFYSIVFAIDPATGAPRWARALDEDLAGVEAVSGGLVIVDRRGKAQWLAASDGRTEWHAELGMAASMAQLRAGAFEPTRAAEGDVIPLEDQLLVVAQSTDARLVPGRTLAVQLLGALPDPRVTGHLVEVCGDRRAPRGLRTAACAELGERADGEEHILEALRRHASFLDDTGAPPAGALGRAAVRMNERQAVPLLLSHLTDPQTAVEELAPLCTSLKDLGDRTAVEPLTDFLRLYHADAEDAPMAAALNAAIDALAALLGPASAETLEEIAGDALGAAPVRAHAQEVLTALRAQAEAPAP